MANIDNKKNTPLADFLGTKDYDISKTPMFKELIENIKREDKNEEKSKI